MVDVSVPDAAAAANNDYIMIFILLGLMAFFLLRQMASIRSSGIKVRGPAGEGTSGGETSEPQDDDEEEEEEEAEDENEDKQD